MRILFISSFVPSVATAGQNYSRLLLNKLTRQKIDVDLVLFRNSQQNIYESQVDSIVVQRYFNDTIFTKVLHCCLCFFLHPFFTARFSLKRMFYINNLIKSNNYDVIYLDFSQVFIYSLFFPKKKNMKILYMSHDVITQKYARSSNILMKLWVEMSEYIILRKIDNVKRKIYTFSQKDVDCLWKYFRLKSNYTDFFLDNIVLNASPNILSDEYVMFGSWNRPENRKGLVWLLKIWKEKYLTVNTKLVIIGGGLDKVIQEEISGFSNVFYTGFVADPYLRIANARALIAPLFQGAGVKVKVIEALACGTPVIGTHVAFEGIPDYMDFALHYFETDIEFEEILNDFESSLEYKKDIKRKFMLSYNNNKIMTEF